MMRGITLLILVCGVLAMPATAQQGTASQRGAADVNEAFVDEVKSDLTDLIRRIESYGTDAISMQRWVDASNVCANKDKFFAGMGFSGADSDGCMQMSPIDVTSSGREDTDDDEREFEDGDCGWFCF